MQQEPEDDGAAFANDGREGAIVAEARKLMADDDDTAAGGD